MSEPIPAEILIGGRMAGKLVPGLCDAISIEDLRLEWGEAPFQPNTAAELLANTIEHDGMQVLRLCDDQARYGRFVDLEAFLEQQGIAFDRFSDGKYEYDAEWVGYRPGSEPVTIATNAGREPTVTASVLSAVVVEVASAIKKLSRGETPQALAVLRALQDALESENPKIPSPLASLEIEAEPVPA